MKGIIFDAESVRAILDGTKTQTRRVVKKLPDTFYDGEPCEHSWPAKRCNSICSDCWEKWLELCPYKQGTIVHVKETFALDSIPNHPNVPPVVHYRADRTVVSESFNGHWRSPLHMPERSSRIKLRLTDVRVQRVQDITEEDVIAEGISFDGEYWRSVVHPIKGTLKCWPTAKIAYEQRWQALNTKRGYSWQSNPWVWTITFEVSK